MGEQRQFYETEAGQFIANAYRYLSAAKNLTDPENWLDLHRLPSLHLLAHGIELFLKYPLLRIGLTQTEISRKYGHNLLSLWDAQQNDVTKLCVVASAKLVWEEAKESDYWPDDFSGDAEQSLIGGLKTLSHLHGRDSSFALRYTVKEPMLAPRPRFLIETFSEVAERTCHNPNYINFWR